MINGCAWIPTINVHGMHMWPCSPQLPPHIISIKWPLPPQPKIKVIILHNGIIQLILHILYKFGPLGCVLLFSLDQSRSLARKS